MNTQTTPHSPPSPICHHGILTKMLLADRPPPTQGEAPGLAKRALTPSLQNGRQLHWALPLSGLVHNCTTGGGQERAGGGQQEQTERLW